MYKGYHVDTTLIVHLYIIGCFLLTNIRCAVFYCDKGSPSITIHANNGTVITRYQDESSYSNDMHCVWIIDSGSATGRVQLTVQRSELDYAPERAICQGYDYVDVRDGESLASESIVSWCGLRNPRSMTSSGRYLYILFKTNDRNYYQKAGVTLNFSVFNMTGLPGACPSGWTDDVDGGQHCYAVKSHKEIWTDAQKHCGYDHSNLVSFMDDRETDFVTDQVVRLSSIDAKENVWIGLNDITVDTAYVWIDDIKSKAKTRWRDIPHVSNEGLNCVALQHGDGLCEEQFCSGASVETLVKYKFICKMNKVGPTTVHNVPDERSDKGTVGNVQFGKKWIIGVVGGAVAIIIAIIAVFVYRKRNTTFRRVLHRRSGSNAGSNASASSQRLNGSSGAARVVPGAGAGAEQEVPSAPPRDPPINPHLEAPPSYDESQLQVMKGTSRVV